MGLFFLKEGEKWIVATQKMVLNYLSFGESSDFFQ